MSHPPTPTTTANSAPRKPRLALVIATAFGLGYIPKAPGTFASLIATVLFPLIYALSIRHYFLTYISDAASGASYYSAATVFSAACGPVIVTLLVAITGVVASGRVAKFYRQSDPQFVVIDEVSGQHLALLVGSILCWHGILLHYPFGGDFGRAPWGPLSILLLVEYLAVNWKFLLAGFILFRVFDIWKPFPARQAESLPGGWGIMADDWIAAIYAALGLWVLQALGLLWLTDRLG